MLIEGYLEIKSVNTNKTNKAQKTALLSCELGTFVVHHAEINRLADGSHTGVFDLQRIEVNHSVQDGRYYFEVIALLKQMLIPGFNADAIKFGEEQVGNQSADLIANTLTQQENLLIEAAEQSHVDDNKHLFGEHWPLGDSVKLDPNNIDRTRFRRQRDALKTLGYRFDDKTQTWHKSEISL